MTFAPAGTLTPPDRHDFPPAMINVPFSRTRGDRENQSVGDGTGSGPIDRDGLTHPLRGRADQNVGLFWRQTSRRPWVNWDRWNEKMGQASFRARHE